MIFFLLSLFAIIAAIFWAIYWLSPVARVRRLAITAVQNYRAGVDDLSNRSLSLRSGIPETAVKYVEEIRISRLRAIPVDDLRNHKKGLLLQPLKQAGLRTLADVLGWNVTRFSSIRGVGPSSAVNIASTAAAVINESWNQAVPHPTPPFSVVERPLVEAIYRARRFDTTLAPRVAQYRKQMDLHGEKLQSALEKTTFLSWLKSVLDSKALEAGKAEAECLCRELAATQSSQYDELTSSIKVGANIANHGADSEELLHEFESNREFYGEALKQLLGKAGAALPTKAAPGAIEPISIPVAPQLSAQTKPIRAQSVQSFTFEVGGTFPDKKFQASHLWLPAGRAVNVHGYTIPGGLLYFGHLDLSKSSPEPSVIDPTLPVAGPTGCHDRLMGYWPSYSSISPEARAAYLGWLSTGKSDPQADIGYVFLYFYGIEKRLFTLPSFDPKITPEVDVIRNEVERLAGIYGDRGTFGSYSGSLLDYIEAKNITVPESWSIPEIPNPSSSPLRHLNVKVGAGIYANAGQSLPSEWAYCLYASRTSGGVHLAEDPFADLRHEVFNVVYKESFGDGITFSKMSPKISVDHHFGNASLMHSTNARIEIPLPDVTTEQQAMEGILKVGNEAIAVIRKFSTLAAENPEECNSLSGLGILPAAVWPPEIRGGFEVIRSASPKVIAFKDLPGYPRTGPALKRFRLNKFIERLASIGLGIDPDSRLGGEIPSRDCFVVIFAAGELENCSSVSKHFDFAGLLLQLASVVAASSEGISDIEASTILNYLDTEIELPQHERSRLTARLAIYRQFPPSAPRLKKQINGIATDIRESMGSFLVNVAGADGTVDPREVRALEDIFRLLGLEQASLYSKIHKVQTQGKVSHAGKDRSLPGIGKIQFDAERVAALRSDSVRISTILDRVFESTEEPANTPTISETPDNVLGMDSAHADLLSALLSKPQWTRSDAEQLCLKRGLMIDGAFERINDAAFERFDAAILEGDDLIDVNCDLIVKEAT